MKRSFIALIGFRRRQPVGALINPVFEPLITAAEAAIDTVVERRLVAHMGKTNHHYRVRLASLAVLDRYLHLGQRPPRFPPGGRKRLQRLWASLAPGAEIEVTEFMAVIGLRAVGNE